MKKAAIRTTIIANSVKREKFMLFSLIDERQQNACYDEKEEALNESRRLFTKYT
jgi:hypothetical protein